MRILKNDYEREMIVYFSASARDMKANIGTYRVIIGAAQEAGCIIANDWTEMANYRSSLPHDFDWWIDMCERSRLCIHDADIIMAESSGISTFGVGYEIATALQSGKHVLALVRKDQVGASYTLGLKHPKLTAAIYTPETLATTVKRFIARQNGEKS